MQGRLRKGMKIRMMATGAEFDVTEVGYFKPGLVNVDELEEGQVGFFAASIKNVKDARVGDTVTDAIILPKKRCPVTARLHRWYTAVCIR